MKILLPPSETKRPGGDGPPLDMSSLAFPSLHAHRTVVIDALVALSADEEKSRRVLKLSARQVADVVHNRMLLSAPTMPAIDRYTGVLFDALDARSLSTTSRRWLGDHVWIHSAPFGPVRALDGIPPYRLAAGTSLPGMVAMRRHWAEATSSALAEAAPAFVLDLRSEAYVGLGAIPGSIRSAYVRVVTDDGDGGVRALNHFNKKTKGQLVRALAESRARIGSLRSLLTWASRNGFVIRRTPDADVLELVVVD